MIFVNLFLLSSCTIVLDKDGNIVGAEHTPQNVRQANHNRDIALQQAERNRQARLNKIFAENQINNGSNGVMLTPAAQAVYNRELRYKEAELRQMEERQRQQDIYDQTPSGMADRALRVGNRSMNGQ